MALSLVALYASVQEDTDALLKSITVCAIMGTLSVLADIAFCSLWAREVSEQSFCNIYFSTAYPSQPKCFAKCYATENRLSTGTVEL